MLEKLETSSENTEACIIISKGLCGTVYSEVCAEENAVQTLLCKAALRLKVAESCMYLLSHTQQRN